MIAIIAIIVAIAFVCLYLLQILVVIGLLIFQVFTTKREFYNACIPVVFIYVFKKYMIFKNLPDK